MATNIKNIDVDKFLEALDKKERDASYNHLLKSKVEEARYNQERETLEQVIDMFYCCSYEKEDSINISKQQYDDYQALLNNFDYEVDKKVQQERITWSREILTKITNSLKSEEYLIYGSDRKKKICNISYEELDKVIKFVFAHMEDVKEYYE